MPSSQKKETRTKSKGSRNKSGRNNKPVSYTKLISHNGSFDVPMYDGSRSRNDSMSVYGSSNADAHKDGQQEYQNTQTGHQGQNDPHTNNYFAHDGFGIGSWAEGESAGADRR